MRSRPRWRDCADERERSAVAHAAVAALRRAARVQGGGRQQRRLRQFRRLDHRRAVPAPVRRGGQGVAALRHLRLEPDRQARAARGRRVPSRARALRAAWCRAMADAARPQVYEVAEADRRRCAMRPPPMRRSTPRRSRASASPSTRYEEGWAWGQLEADGYVGLPARERAARSGPRADPQGRGAAHAGVPRAVDQASAGRGAGARMPARRRTHRRTRSRSPPPAATCRRAISFRIDERGKRFRRGRRALPGRAVSVGRQDVARSRLFGPAAGRARRVRRCLSARQRHAGAGARSRACALDRARANCGAAISCSGAATSPSCATRRRSFTPMPSTWRSRSSRSRRRSRASAPAAAR